MTTMRNLYAVYTDTTPAPHKALSSFKNKGELEVLIARYTPKPADPTPPKPTKKNAPTKDEGTVELTATLTKVQRMTARRWYAQHPKLTRPEGWVGASIPRELAKVLGVV